MSSAIVDLYQHQRLFKAHLAVVWTAFNGLKGTIPSHILANLMAVKMPIKGECPLKKVPLQEEFYCTCNEFFNIIKSRE